MATSYVRQSSFADGDTITAALFNDEFNRLLTAFSYASSSTTGHRHDGTAGEGGNIHTIGDQDFLNKILTTGNTWEFYVEVSSAAAKQMVLQDGALVPNADSDLDLGTSSIYFKDAYIDSITTTGNVAVGGNLTVTGTTTFNGGTLTLGNAADDNVVFGADVNSSIIPNTDDTYDLGSASQEWRDLYVDGTAYLDVINLAGTAITSTAAELNILDGVTSTAAELNILDGVTSTAAELNILDGVTSTAAELNILDGVTSTAAELNALDGITAVVGELNALDIGSTAVGTAVASKAVILDSSKDYTGIRNLTISGELDAATLDVSGAIDIAGNSVLASVDVTGLATASTFEPDGDTSAGDNAAIGYAAADGLVLTGQGSTGDVTIRNDADALVAHVPTGTNGVTFAGDVIITDGDLILGSTAVTSTAAELNILDGKSFLDEDNLASDSATGIASQQSIKAYVDASGSGSMSSFILEDEDGTEVSISDAEEVKFIGVGLTTNWTDTTPGSDGDPFDLTFTVDAAQTGITSIYATDLIIGEDAQTAIDFGTANEIDFKVDNAARLTLTTGALYPVTNNQIDLGTSSLEFKDAFFDGTVTADAFAGPLTGNVTGNVSGTALTVTQAAQSAITSLGTLTALTVDDLAIDGKVITMTGSTSDTAVITAGTNGTLSIVTTDAAAAAANIQITADGTVDIDSAGVLTLDSGAAINIEPAVGSAILLDGTISIDAGVVTGATSVTSTAFVGALTGNVTGNASGTALTVTQAAQTAITTVGTLTTLTVDNVIINGSTIGHTDDTDLITVADGIVTVAGEVSLTTLDIGGTNVTSTAAELNALDGITAVVGELNALDIGSTAVGTAVASKAVILDSSKDYTGVRNLTITGELDAATLDISGDVDVDGTLETDALSLNGTTVTSTAAELNIVDAVSRGSLIYGNASAATALLTKGTAAQVLTSDGTDIAWADAGGSAIWTFIDRYDITSGANTHDFTGDFTSTYDEYWIKLIDWYHDTGGAGTIDFQFYRGGSLKTGDLYNSNGIRASGADGSTALGFHKPTLSAQGLTFTNVRSDPTDDSFNGNLFVYNANSDRISYNFMGGNFSDDTGVASHSTYNGYHYEDGTVLTGIRIMDKTSTGTTKVAGRIEIYGGTKQT